jgi:DNA-binding ferritin-like protein
MLTEVAEAQRKAPLKAPSNLGSNAAGGVSAALTAPAADFFALYLKTKNFHWYVPGAHLRDYHLVLDEHAGQIFVATEAIAERVRKIGGTNLRSIGHIARLQRVMDNDAEYVTPRYANERAIRKTERRSGKTGGHFRNNLIREVRLSLECSGGPFVMLDEAATMIGYAESGDAAFFGRYDNIALSDLGRELAAECDKVATAALNPQAAAVP